jgi:hypothetical protein
MKKLKKKNYIGKNSFFSREEFIFFSSFILYLKQFSIHKNKTTEEILASIECCPKGIESRFLFCN